LLLQINYFQSNEQAPHAKVEKVELIPQGALENLELKAENRTQKENDESSNSKVLPGLDVE
jgi:hypothetical protein